MVTSFFNDIFKNRIGTTKQHLVAENSVNHMENFLSCINNRKGIK
jgi:hypothetical protein